VSTTTKEPSATASDYRMTSRSSWSGAWKIAAAAGALGLGVAAYGYKTDPARTAYAYLFAFVVALSLALGSLFFVMVLHVTKAFWGVTVRRVAEMFIRPMAVFAILIIPMVYVPTFVGGVGANTLGLIFPWAGAKHAEQGEKKEAPSPSEAAAVLAEERGISAREPAAMRELPLVAPKRMENAEEAAEATIVNHKRFYLNPKFFLGRLVAYLLIWTWLAQRYFTWSTDQDKTKALENTAEAQRFSPLGIILFALTITFFGFDWLLSLDATWYSTIFGVYIFASSALFQMAVLILVTLLLRRSGLLGDAVNVEHYHDMGKLLFGWIVFWSYIAFAQFFLTWYSNIPDEVAWFHKRWHDNGGTWKGISLSLVALQFFVPFWFLMSRNIKRRLPLLAIGSVCLVVMHVVEVYWIVMPNYGPLELNLVDVGCLVGVLGVYLATVLYGMREYPLVAVGDPRLVRALEFENA
jgi:hypothetical protein